MKVKLKKLIRNQDGVTLFELLVALTLFSIVVLATTQIFNMVVKAQREALASRAMQEDMRFLLEVVAKEVRMAQIDMDRTCIGLNYDVVYYITNQGKDLTFLNVNDECVTYSFDEANNQFLVSRNGQVESILSSGTKVKDLEFLQYGSIPLEQPRVVIRAEIEIGGEVGVSNKVLNFQTSISSRHYE